LFLLAAALAWLPGCAQPISAVKTPPRAAYQHATANALGSGTCSSQTLLVLHRFDLKERFKKAPAQTLQYLHERALADNRSDLLFALAELSYLHGENLRRHKTLKPWEPKPFRDYFLCSAIYAQLYLAKDVRERGGPFDPSVRIAVDLYNRALARGFMVERGTEDVVVLESGVRALPPGPVRLEFSQPGFPWRLEDVDYFVSADSFDVRGLTVRDQQAGLGATLIAVAKATNSTPLAVRIPATLLLRVPDDLKQWSAGRLTAAIELYSGYDKPTVEIAGRTVPLRTDTTAPLAHVLNEKFVWKLGMTQFFSSEQRIKTGVYPTQPYQSGRVPVVFVHGTFSSPIWWAEMLNTLRADPVLSGRCQFWYYIYNSGNTLTYSAANFRDAITNIVHACDPEGNDPALRQMVVIGHSQGGLLAKMAVTDPDDRLWRALTNKKLDDLKLSAAQRAQIERTLFFKPLPMVTRAVFISTPHRGSYMATSFVRKLAARFMSLPGDLIHLRESLGKVIDDLQLPSEMRAVPTSLDSMSTKNPLLLALADIPPAPGVKTHSIIAVKTSKDPKDGNDGVVKYKSAHVDYAASELVVRSGHTCQDKPATIEEVRRILLEHLAECDRLAPPARAGLLKSPQP
jgi:triacylglycerol esterase/lipase EstA (alpha/beta hydrolase family)